MAIKIITKIVQTAVTQYEFNYMLMNCTNNNRLTLAQTTTRFFNTRAKAQRLLLSALLVTSLISCTPQSDVIRNIETYSERLANVLETHPPKLVSPSRAIDLPKIEKQALASKAAALTLKDFYALPSCGTLKSIIAEHNTSLARTQDEVMHFLYHDALLKALTNCQFDEDADNYKTQIEKAQALIALKRADKAISWRNVLYTDAALRSTLSSPEIMLEADIEQYSLSLAEFQYLQQLSQQIAREQISQESVAQNPFITESALPQKKPLEDASDPDKQRDLLNAIKHISQQKLPAKMWNTLAYYRDNFTLLNAFLEDELSQLDCSTPKGKKQSEYLSNVMRLFFIEKIQPFASNINKQHYQLAPMLQQLYLLPEVAQTSPAMNLFIETQTATLFEQYQSALLKHVQIWQKMFKACGVKVG